MSISDSIKWLLFTQKCKLCGKVIEKDKELCDECESSDLEVIGETCIYCGLEKKRCTCKKRKSFYDGIISPYYYDKGVGVGLRRLKFGNKIYASKIFAEEMSRVVKEKYNDIHFDFITFVPFSKAQKLIRKYNTSELLAIELSKCLNLKLEKAIIKIFDNETQHSTRKAHRKGNVIGVYDVDSGIDVVGKTVLLVDDIKTSGATLNECAKMLKIRGAEKVYCVTAALAVKEK